MRTSNTAPPRNKRSVWVRIKMLYHDHPPEAVFLLVSITFGILFAFIVPPTQVPDELEHFFRAYDISTGHLVAQTYDVGGKMVIGGQVPLSIQTMGYNLLPDGGKALTTGPKLTSKLINKFGQVPLNPGIQGPANFPNTSLYSPLAYVPQVAAIKAGRYIFKTPLELFYAARLANLIVYIGLIVLAIRLMPFGRWGLVAIALLPTALSQAASASADGMMDSLTMLTFAYFLKLYVAAKPLSKRSIFTLVTLGACLTLIKSDLIIFAILPLLLPAKLFKRRRAYFGIGTSCVLLCILISAGWARIIRNFVPFAVQAFFPSIHINPAAQLKWIITHPPQFIHSVGVTIFSQSSFGIPITLVGTDHAVPTLPILASYATLLLTWLASVPKPISKQLRHWLWLLLLGGIGLIIVTLSLVYNNVGSPLIIGIHGRYFIPLLPLAMVLIMTSGWHLKVTKFAPLLYSLGILFPLTAILIRVFVSYYG